MKMWLMIWYLSALLLNTFSSHIFINAVLFRHQPLCSSCSVTNTFLLHREEEANWNVVRGLCSTNNPLKHHVPPQKTSLFSSIEFNWIVLGVCCRKHSVVRCEGLRGSALHGNIVNCTQLPVAKLDAQKEHIHPEMTSEMERGCDTCSSESPPPSCRLGDHMSTLLTRDSDQLKSSSHWDQTWDRRQNQNSSDKENSFSLGWSFGGSLCDVPEGLWLCGADLIPTPSHHVPTIRTQRTELLYRNIKLFLENKVGFNRKWSPRQSSRTAVSLLFNEKYKLICCVALNLKRWK